MKFTFSWLKEHLDTKASLEDVVERLTMIGLEVDKVHDRAQDLAGFVVARVVEAKKHPDADKLTVCRVDNGSETVEVVCGAPNARTGLLGVFAASGAYIPGTGITLKPTEIRGVVSNGMLLSEKEVNLSDDHDGLINMPADAASAAPAASVTATCPTSSPPNASATVSLRSDRSPRKRAVTPPPLRAHSTSSSAWPTATRRRSVPPPPTSRSATTSRSRRSSTATS